MPDQPKVYENSTFGSRAAQPSDPAPATKAVEADEVESVENKAVAPERAAKKTAKSTAKKS